MQTDRATFAEETSARLAALGLGNISTNEGLARAGLIKTGARYGVGMARIWDGATCLGFFDHITAWGPILERLERDARPALAA